MMQLSDGWAIGADNSQWIVLKWRPPYWRPVSFVGSTKAILFRVLREKGAEITPEAQTMLDSLPNDFKTHGRSGGNVVASAVEASGVQERPAA